MPDPQFCPECEHPDGDAMNRRDFVKTAGTAAAALAAVGIAGPEIARAAESELESLIKEWTSNDIVS